MKIAFAERFVRRSRKHTDSGILGAKSHSYYTAVNAKKCGTLPISKILPAKKQQAKQTIDTRAICTSTFPSTTHDSLGISAENKQQAEELR